MQNADPIAAAFLGAPGKPATPRSEWAEVLFAATSEVFSMMVGSPVARASQTSSLLKQNVTGTVGIAGAMRAAFTLRCSSATANKIASAMLGVPAEEAAAQSGDAVGEICNMVAGHFKAKIGREADCMLSVPMVIMGSDYHVHSQQDGEHLSVPVLFAGDLLEIALEIRK